MHHTALGLAWLFLELLFYKVELADEILSFFIEDFVLVVELYDGLLHISDGGVDVSRYHTGIDGLLK